MPQNTINPDRIKIVVYIAGPYRAKTPQAVTQNITRARTQADFALRLGYTVICPHLLSQGLELSATDDFWLATTLEISRRCDVMLLVPGWEKSLGTLGEIELYRELGRPIYRTRKEFLFFCPEYVLQWHPPYSRCHPFLC